MTRPRIALFGLGAMGSGMAHRLLAAGFPLTVFNRNREKLAPLAAGGAQTAGTPREAVAGADIVISMVADDLASRELWLGENGALPAAKPGCCLIESSTLSVDWVRELAANAAQRGCELLDAPVTGSKPQAAAGELTFLVGGTTAALQQARPVLAAMSRAILHLGPSGSGAQLKLINNFVCGVQVAALAEALAMIERSELDRAKALEVLTNGAPGSPLVKTVAARMSAPEGTPNFQLRLMAKDLEYAQKAAAAQSLDLLTADAALRLFRRGIAAGYGEKDIAAVIEPLRRR